MSHKNPTMAPSVEKQLEKSKISDLKRYNSIQEKKQLYQQQKSAIQRALSSVDYKPNRIVFESEDEDTPDSSSKKQKKKKSKKEISDSSFENFDSEIKSNKLNGAKTKNESKKRSLFDENSDDEVIDSLNIERKLQLGDKHLKLAELQAKIVTNDKRFKLDSRFIEDDEIESSTKERNDEQIDDLEETNEKDAQMKILESIVGEQPSTSKKHHKPSKVLITRFDPTEPEHKKYEKRIENKESSKKKKKKIEEAREEEEEQVPVNDEKFYKVTDNLKKVFEENKPFSLTSLFQNNEEDSLYESKLPDERTDQFHAKESKKPPKKSPYDTSNPFRYDSSDTEEEIEEKTVDQERKSKKDDYPKDDSTQPSTNIELNREHFFFSTDDERFQEGLQFIWSISEKPKEEIRNNHREKIKKLKDIVRNKIQINKRRTEQFKKKLGGKPKKKFHQGKAKSKKIKLR